MESIEGERWHDLPTEHVAQLLTTAERMGLDAHEVERRRMQFGANRLPVRDGKGLVSLFASQLRQPLVYLLLVAAAITAVLNEWTDASVIFAVVLVNAIIGVLQEARAARALGALARSVTTVATAIRGGLKLPLDSADLVPGDVVLLQSGDKVPADLRLTECRELRIDESTLTGESLPVEKHPSTLPKDVPLSERANMAFSSTLVTSGQARGMVVAIGDLTEVGRISNLIETADEIETPLTQKINRFSHLLVYVILGLAAATFAVGVWRGEPALETFLASVALVVGAIPEGLPAALTIILAIGVQRMATRRAIIRKLPAVETLGSTTVICTDKTGTLTENAMTVVEAWSGGRSYSLSGTGYAPEGMMQLRDGASQEARKAASDFVVDAHPSLRECLVAGLLCNDSRVFLDGNRWTVHGDPTEGALLVAAGKAGVRAEDRHHRHPRLDTLPFESEHQYMGTLHEGPADGSRMAYIKGAVEKILARCDSMLDGCGEQVPLDAAAVQSEFSRMAAQGLRVLAFARRAVPAHQTLLHHADLDQGLTFLGLQGMIDPPRQEALRAVAACQSAGVRVKMITGDHALTARAIAKKIGILQEGESGHGVAAGTELARLTDDELLEVAERLSVFARVTPQQKLRLVCALQKRGHVVAMTGDGVNDAPALTQADIGVSMGITGTEVAKESADMVLTDDNFASIAAAVEEGRGVFDNLTKFILWTLPTNMGEGLVVLAATLAGTALPILPIQILWINMTTAVLLGLTLAFEPKEPGIMSRAPRSAATPILTDILIGRILMVSVLLLAGAFGLFQWMLADGRSEAVARTVTVNVFVFVQIFYLLNCRSMTQSLFHVGLFSNPWVWLGIAGMTLLQLLYTYTAPMNRLFESSPILATDWIMILAVSVIAFAIVGAEKWLRLQMAR